VIQAVTFDFWDTLVIDDSDEPARAARGLPTKVETRRQLFVEEVLRHQPGVSPGRAAQALQQALTAFGRQWKVEHRTPPVAERLREALALLGLGPTPGFDALVAAWEDMEVLLPPTLAPGVAEMLPALAERAKIGVISDTIVTPGRGLRRILADYNLLQHFDVLIFSDERGASKPSPVVFELAVAELGVPAANVAHIGDREVNDVDGPRRAGMRGVLYTGCVDRRVPGTPSEADAVLTHHDQLLTLISTL